MNGKIPTSLLEDLRVRLVTQAFLFEDPHAYAAGVEDALAAVAVFLPPASAGGGVGVRSSRDG